MAFYGWLMGDKEINSWKLTSLRGSCANGRIVFGGNVISASKYKGENVKNKW